MSIPKIILLTHERELLKITNTGKLALELLPDYVERITWSRVEPYKPLVDLLQNRRAALLYPGDKNHVLSESADTFEYFVVLDATWQQAQKMYNQSPYLKQSVKVSIDTKQASIYQLRRNQRQGGLCTVECISEILKAKGLINEYQALEKKFELFNKR